MVKSLGELNKESCETENIREEFQNYLKCRESIIDLMNNVSDSYVIFDLNLY